MIWITVRALEIATVCALLVAVRYGFVAATEGDSPRKGNARFAATLLVGLAFCMVALSQIIYNSSLPVFELHGIIDSVQVIHGDSRHFSAYLQVHTDSGGDITVHASDRSSYLRAGERVKGRYQGDSGELLKALFFTPDGKQEAILNGTSTLAPYGFILIGLLFIWAGFRKFHRDPEGTGESSDKNPDSLETVDDGSNLNRSRHQPDSSL